MISCQRERCSLKMIVEATRDQWKSKGFFVVKKVDSLSVIQNVTAQYGTVSPRSGTRLAFEEKHWIWEIWLSPFQAHTWNISPHKVHNDFLAQALAVKKIHLWKGSL